jgi:hypothetical protein
MRKVMLSLTLAAAAALFPTRAQAQTYVTGDSFSPVYQSAHETNVVYYTSPGRTYYSGPLVPRVNYLNAHENNVYMGPSYSAVPSGYYGPAYRPAPVYFQSAHEINTIYSPGY